MADLDNGSINSQLMKMHSSGTAANDGTIYPYVIFTLAGELFALNCKYVLSIENIKETTALTNQPKDIRGVSYYKNEALNLYDLKNILGMMNNSEYVNSIIDVDGKIADHKRDLATVENALTKNRPFTVEEDVHNCALGIWQSEYKPDNMAAKSALEKIREPHEKFHETLREIKVMQKNGNIDDAADLCTYLIQKLAPDLFTELENLKSVLHGDKKELVIVLRNEKNKKTGLVIDNADNVEFIEEIQPLPVSVVQTKHISHLGFRKRDRKILLIIEPTAFLTV